MMLKFLLIMELALVCQSFGDDNCWRCNNYGTYKCGLPHTDGSASCICNVGFAEELCEHHKGCDDDTMCNGGTCVFQAGRTQCICPKGRWGRLCEHTDFEVDNITKIEEKLAQKHCGDRDDCEPAHMQITCGPGYLDKCDSYGNVRPYTKCPYPWYCFEAFRNGKCDWECERQECLFDGYECSNKRVCNSSCIINGVCNMKCDLDIRREDADKQDIPSDPIIIEISLSISENFWWKNKNDILTNLSEPLGIPLTYNAKFNDDLAKRRMSLENVLSRSRRSIVKENEVTKINLEMDSMYCNQAAHCTSTCEVAKGILTTVNAKENIRLRNVKCPSPKSNGNAVIAVCFIIIAIPIVLIVRRRVVSAPIWFPPKSVDEAPVVWSHVNPPNPFIENPTALHEEAFSQYKITLPIQREYVNKMDEQGRTPLFWLISSSKIIASMLDDFDELMKEGANPNHSDNEGETPLSIAIKEIRPSICVKLVQCGADPTATTASGASCLHLAVSQGDIKCVEWLLSFPAVRNNINEVDESDRTPLAMAAQGGIASPEITEILIQAGADVLHQGNHTTMWRYRGRSALHWAAQFNNLEVMKVLLHYRSDVNCVDTEGCTALFHAVQRGSETAVRMLLEAQASPIIPNTLGVLPITVATIAGIEPLIDLLQWYTEVRTEGLAIKTKTRKREKYSSDYGSDYSKRSCSSDSPFFSDSNSSNSGSMSSGCFFPSVTDSSSIGSGTSTVSSSSSASSHSGTSCPWSPSSSISTSSYVLPSKTRSSYLPPIEEKPCTDLSFETYYSDDYVPQGVLHSASGSAVVKSESGDAGYPHEYSGSILHSLLLSPCSESSNQGSGGPTSPVEHLGTSYWTDPERPNDGFTNEEILQEFFVNFQY